MTAVLTCPAGLRCVPGSTASAGNFAISSAANWWYQPLAAPASGCPARFSGWATMMPGAARRTCAAPATCSPVRATPPMVTDGRPVAALSASRSRDSHVPAVVPEMPNRAWMPA